jgi:hypothetical protein
MKPADTKRIYEAACKARRMDPVQEEGKEWHDTLRSFEERDVETAMKAWWASTDRDAGGELRSKWPPKAGELKSLVIVAQRKREAAAREPKDFVAWECPWPEGCAWRCTGWRSPEDLRGRKCDRCGRSMHEALREKAPHVRTAEPNVVQMPGDRKSIACSESGDAA